MAVVGNCCIHRSSSVIIVSDVFFLKERFLQIKKFYYYFYLLLMLETVRTGLVLETVTSIPCNLNGRKVHVNAISVCRKSKLSLERTIHDRSGNFVVQREREETRERERHEKNGEML